VYRKAVYPYEANFVFHAFEEYTNTTQEALFSAIKKGSLAVLPSMDIDMSLQQLNQQAAKKVCGTK
jgi:hypothetical protein